MTSPAGSRPAGPGNPAPEPAARRPGAGAGAIVAAGHGLWLLVLIWALLVPGALAAAGPVPVHVFWREGCPHCAHATEALGRMAAARPEIVLDRTEVGVDDAGDVFFLKVLLLFEIPSPAVPLVVIGDRHVLGFSEGGTTEAVYAGLLDRCDAAPCPDVVADLRRLSDLATGRADPTDAGAPATLPRAVELPLVGRIDLAGLSFPLVTVVLAGVDGFNPCAMWVLVLLIGLLLGVRDLGRIWALGLTFLLVTAAMYLGIMAAWLNLVLWIGAAVWLRIAIGALAVTAGLFYLRDYWTNPEGVCRVTSGAGRGRIGAAFRRVVETPSLPLAMAGIAALAVGVNLIELVCSAGVPAIFTQLLAMQDLSPAGHYGYLLLYIAVFLLDDAVILLTALIALRSTALTGRYARLSHAVGGGVLLALGAVMVLRPEWLG